MSDLVEILGKVSEIWLAPQHPQRQETIRALQVSTGLSQRQIEMALANCFEELSASKIRACLRDWGQSPEIRLNASLGTVPRSAPRSASQSVFHVLPSNAFTAWVHGAVTTVLVGHRCVLKPSAREPVFALGQFAMMRQFGLAFLRA